MGVGGGHSHDAKGKKPASHNCTSDIKPLSSEVQGDLAIVERNKLQGQNEMITKMLLALKELTEVFKLW